ncbi:NUDIX domain-containing protein [Candidatus Gottesmanbacteria bacterium]|nr:NUDIX domain-containing protein [Candidatus Gottesmanbacteria bacterium]
MNNLLFTVNVEGIIQKDNHFLLVKRSKKETHAPGKWSLVGGKVENPSAILPVLEDTLRREIKEEVNIEVENEMKYLTSSFFTTDDKKSVIDIVFLCKYKSGQLSLVDRNELSEIKWMSYEEIMENQEIISFTKKCIELVKVKEKV